MAKYRKKPIIVEAEQWFPQVTNAKAVTAINSPDFAIIETLEGNMLVRSGDWIVKGIKGERYPVKDSIFKATYEKVED